jgi:amino acid transporter
LSKAPIFVREATGFVRELSSFDAFVISFGIFNVGCGTATFVAYALSMYPGVNLFLSLTICNFISLAFALLYAFMAIAMPRSGGDYVWVSRILHPALGVMNGISTTVWMMFLLAYQMWLTASYGIPVSFNIVGSLTNNTGLTNLATLLSSNNYVFGISVVLLAFFSVLAIYSTKLTMKVAVVMFVVAVIAFPIVFFVVVAPMTPSAFAGVFNSYAGPNMYDKIISQAQQMGLKYPSSSLPPTLLSIPIAFLSFTGFNWVTSAAGEVKRVSRSMIIALVGTQIIGWLVFSAVAVVATNSFGYNFMTSLGYVYYTNSTAYPLPLPTPWLNYVTAIALYGQPNGLFLVNFMNLGFMFWMSIFGGILIITITRNIFALSFDRAFPTKLADVNDKFHTPVKAIIITFIVGVFMLYLLIYTTLFFYLLNFTLGLMIAQILPGIAGVLFPYRSKDTFDSAPGFVKAKIGPLPLISVLGGIVAVSFAIMSAIMAANPLLSGVTGGSFGFIGALIIFGFAVYYVSVLYHKRKGLDIALAFKMIPPE